MIKDISVQFILHRTIFFVALFSLLFYQVGIFFRYVDKFGFRFVICSRMSNIEIILKGLRVRCRNSLEDEVANGIEEVKKITALRMKDLLRN